MFRLHRDEAIILKKTLYPNSRLRLSVLSKTDGKLSLMAYGVKKITSRRLSHLETGNLITLTYNEKDGILTLQETEIIYAYSKIKGDLSKLKLLYLLLFILERLLPEKVPEEVVYSRARQFLKDLNNKPTGRSELEEFLKWFLLHSGYIDKKTASSVNFSVTLFAEELLGRKLPKVD